MFLVGYRNRPEFPSFPCDPTSCEVPLDCGRTQRIPIDGDGLHLAYNRARPRMVSCHCPARWLATHSQYSRLSALLLPKVLGGNRHDEAWVCSIGKRADPN